MTAISPIHRLKIGAVLFVFASAGLLFFDPFMGGGPSSERRYAQDTDWMRAELIRLEAEERERRR